MEAQDLGDAALSALYSNPRGLYPFQGELVGYSYLRPRNLGVVDTGLGKTHIGLATAALLVEDDLVDLVLVVAEGNKIDEWMDDIATFTRLTATKYKGDPGRRERILGKLSTNMLVMTYQTARSDLVKSVSSMQPGFLTEYLTGKRLFVIYDEVTLLGGLTSGLHKVHRQLIHSTGARALGLTATPVTASPENFYALGLIFCPDLVGSIADFNAAHVVRRDSFGNAAQFRDIEGLAAKMSPILMRKRKTDADVVNQFPREVEDFVRIVLNDDHRAAYDELVALIEEMGENEEIEPRLCFNLLRSFANHPNSLVESGSVVAERFFQTHDPAVIAQIVCAKSESAVRQIRQITSQDGDNQVVLFSDSVTVLKGLAADLDKAKIPYAQYHGGLTHDRREAEKLDFKSGRKRVLLASSAAERGVNLPEANYIINYDVPLLHSSYIQRLSRASRIGSATSDDILVIKTLIASRTVEDGAVSAWKRRNRDSDKLIDFDVDENDPHFVTAAARAALIRRAS